MRACALVVGLLMLVWMTGCTGGDSGGIQASTPSADPSPAQNSIPAGDAPIEPGTYRVPKSAWSAVDFAVRFPDDWTVEYGHVYATRTGRRDGGWLLRCCGRLDLGRSLRGKRFRCDAQSLVPASMTFPRHCSSSLGRWRKARSRQSWADIRQLGSTSPSRRDSIFRSAMRKTSAFRSGTAPQQDENFILLDDRNRQRLYPRRQRATPGVPDPTLIRRL